MASKDFQYLKCLYLFMSVHSFKNATHTDVEQNKHHGHAEFRHVPCGHRPVPLVGPPVRRSLSSPRSGTAGFSMGGKKGTDIEAGQLISLVHFCGRTAQASSSWLQTGSGVGVLAELACFDLEAKPLGVLLLVVSLVCGVLRCSMAVRGRHVMPFSFRLPALRHDWFQQCSQRG